jgi:predicted transcriptional regulator of viral defense system
MASEHDIVRSAGPKAALVLEELADARRHTLALPSDRGWLSRFTADPNSLLQRMADAQLLYRVGRGRYVVAPRGTFSAMQAASTDLMVHLMLSSRGDYYIGFLSALIGHRLTDLHSTTVFAAIRQRSSFAEVEIELPTGLLKLVRLTDSRWPKETDRELDLVRALPDSEEVIRRSSLERTLVDCLSRPDLSGDLETVITCWAAAVRRETDWDLVSAIAARQSLSMARRTAFVLRLLGLGAVAKRNFPNLTGRGAKTPLDRSNSFGMDQAEIRRDRETGVLINVPEDHLAGWASAS